jgi:hypothetical protein
MDAAGGGCFPVPGLTNPLLIIWRDERAKGDGGGVASVRAA